MDAELAFKMVKVGLAIIGACTVVVSVALCTVAVSAVFQDWLIKKLNMTWLFLDFAKHRKEFKYWLHNVKSKRDQSYFS